MISDPAKSQAEVLDSLKMYLAKLENELEDASDEEEMRRLRDLRRHVNGLYRQYSEAAI